MAAPLKWGLGKAQCHLVARVRARAIEALVCELAVLVDLPLQCALSYAAAGELLRHGDNWLSLQSGLRATEADQKAVLLKNLGVLTAVEPAALQVRLLPGLADSLHHWPNLEATGTFSGEVRHLAN